ncbi:MAG TPA: prepilin-type N-terminal cleavage/methylation domain-containing protein [Candidatus Saccharimonadales bacterium]|nr:prepilin-type N-terminal cleavage/methylation domain-containing protein [Candidatus Saccharimonadales bacterium]
MATRLIRQAGFSVVEVLLAVVIFAMVATAVVGALIYGRSSTAEGGDRIRANFLAEEGVEAVRNIRNAGYANLTDGTYGLAQNSGVWSLSGSSDTKDMYTRSVTIAPNGTNRKLVTSTIAWSGTGGSNTTSVATQLTNWSAAIPKSWAVPSQYGGTTLTGSAAGFKVATAGSYAYVVKNSSTGPNFFVINISNPASPTLAGSLTLTGTPTNIVVSGNYAYVSNSLSTAELQIVNITTPTGPTLAGTYNASGTAGGRGVFAIGTTVYLVRAANSTNDEFVIVNAANPAAPTRVAGYSLNITMNEVFVSGTAAYVATASDTQEILVLNLLLSPLLTLGTSVNLAGTNDATTITGYGSTLVVGHGTTLSTVSFLATLVPLVSGSLTLPGTINDIALDTVRNYAFVGTNFATGEFRIVNLTNPASPAALSNVNMTGSLNLTGVAYNATYDVVLGANSSTAQGVVVFGPN